MYPVSFQKRSFSRDSALSHWPAGSLSRSTIHQGGTDVTSRTDSATITRAEWVEGEDGLQWWTVCTDKTGDSSFRIIGVTALDVKLDRGHTKRTREKFIVGNTIQLADLASVSMATGLMAYSDSPKVLSGIGRVRDQLEDICGPIAYLEPRCRTRDDTVDPSSEQMEALRQALSILMLNGIQAAQSFLEKTCLFDSIFEDADGCPVNPTRLRGGAFEWK
jgi:hypothetical protein